MDCAHLSLATATGLFLLILLLVTQPTIARQHFSDSQNTNLTVRVSVSSTGVEAEQGASSSREPQIAPIFSFTISKPAKQHASPLHQMVHKEMVHHPIFLVNERRSLVMDGMLPLHQQQPT
jgi:hypothetical protein